MPIRCAQLIDLDAFSFLGSRYDCRGARFLWRLQLRLGLDLRLNFFVGVGLCIVFSLCAPFLRLCVLLGVYWRVGMLNSSLVVHLRYVFFCSFLVHTLLFLDDGLDARFWVNAVSVIP